MPDIYVEITEQLAEEYENFAKRFRIIQSHFADEPRLGPLLERKLLQKQSGHLVALSDPILDPRRLPPHRNYGKIRKFFLDRDNEPARMKEIAAATGLTKSDIESVILQSHHKGEFFPHKKSPRNVTYRFRAAPIDFIAEDPVPAPKRSRRTATAANSNKPRSAPPKNQNRPEITRNRAGQLCQRKRDGKLEPI